MESKLYIYDKSSKLDRDQAAGRFSGDKDVLIIGVALGVKNLEYVFYNLAENRRTFDRVVIQTHGSSGAIKFGEEYIHANMWKSRFTPFRSIFPRYTRMYFDGCNVAEGEFGTDFLLAAGSVFLNISGGEVFGWTDVGHGVWGSIPLIGGHTLHFGGHSALKRIHFFPGGEPNWPDSNFRPIERWEREREKERGDQEALFNSQI